LSIPLLCIPAIEDAADTPEAWWQPDPSAFRSQEVSHAFATHAIDSRRTAMKLARIDLNRIWLNDIPYVSQTFARLTQL